MLVQTPNGSVVSMAILSLLDGLQDASVKEAGAQTHPRRTFRCIIADQHAGSETSSLDGKTVTENCFSKPGKPFLVDSEEP
jgi:hypothetical protein